MIEEVAKDQIETYGKKFCLTRKMTINDDLGAFMKVPTVMGNHAARLIDQLFFSRLLANHVQADGKVALTDDKLKKEAAALAPGEYVIRTTGNDLRIFGKNIAGTICGMYAFLRDDIGVKFFGINDLFTVMPAQRITAINSIDR